jgi:hypothetical protein
MTNAEILVQLKIDLGITVTNYDSRLEHLISTAEREITAAGATIQMEGESVSDPAMQQLIIMYAGWLWRKRESGEGMPRMVKRALNDAVFSSKMRTEGE